MVTIHNLSIRKVAEQRSEPVQTTGLSKFLRHLDEKFDFGIPSDERCRRIPDAWSYVPDHRDDMPGTVYLFEIEDSHALSVEKLREYADLCTTYDFYDLDVRLFVYDRYGENEREIDLREYYMMFLVADAQEKRQGAAR